MAKGTKRLRGLKWELKVYSHTETDEATGEKRKKYEYSYVEPVTYRGRLVAASAPVADTALAALVTRVNRARAGGASTPKRRRSSARSVKTVREAGEIWRKEVGPTLEPNGRDQDRRDLENHVYPHIGDVDLWRLRPFLLGAPTDPDWDDELVSMSDFYTTLRTKGGVGRAPAIWKDRQCVSCGIKRRRDRAQDEQPHKPDCRLDEIRKTRVGAGTGLSADTVVRIAGTCQRMFAYSQARNWVTINPATGAKVPTVSSRPSTMPQPVALAAFLRWLKNNGEEELLAFIHAVVYNGGRRLDIGIQWPDVDFDEGVITYVGRAVIIAKGGAGGDGKEEVFVRTTPTKKRKPRVAALTPEGIGALRDHHAKAMELAFDCGIALDPDAYVFSHEADGSQPVRPDFFTKRFRIAREACGIPGMAGVRLYDCRHALITQLKAERVPDSVIAERCGNSERTMDQKYRQRIDPADKAAAVALSRAMREAGQPPG
jgi:hypothetical protein